MTSTTIDLAEVTSRATALAAAANTASDLIRTNGYFGNAVHAFSDHAWDARNFTDAAFLANSTPDGSAGISSAGRDEAIDALTGLISASVTIYRAAATDQPYGFLEQEMQSGRASSRGLACSATITTVDTAFAWLVALKVDPRNPKLQKALGDVRGLLAEFVQSNPSSALVKIGMAYDRLHMQLQVSAALRVPMLAPTPGFRHGAGRGCPSEQVIHGARMRTQRVSCGHGGTKSRN